MKHPNTGNAFVAADDLLERVRKSGESLILSSPDPEVMLLLIPKKDYNQIKDVLGLKHPVPTQPAKAPHQLFTETLQRLRELEHKYGISSQEFYERFQAGQIEEGPSDYFDWRVEYGAYLTLKEQFGFSEEKQSD
jgi:hypothetical protein